MMANRTTKTTLKKLQTVVHGCLMIDGYNEVKTDDVIEAYVMEEINIIEKR